ncbi:MAG: SARP family transcriptional regulator [Clostridiales bacterium]|jgi:DNA-binding SARP family transcriptional activator|nr:SARP family transcriptional regulator [Clostridiales bacterium]
MSDKTMTIQMFGGFLISLSGRTISDQNNRSKKVWTILAYLIAFRDREISQRELIELLWGDGDTKSHVNALKTLLYRARQMLEDLGIENSKKIIRTRRGYYSWNNELPVSVDTEEFDRLVEAAEKTLDETEKLAIQLKALSLYKGNFLPNISGALWAVNLCARYHSKYTELVYNTVLKLDKTSRFGEIIALCRKAVAIDPYDEQLHRSLIQTLIKADSQNEALRHYEYVTDLFFNQFAITPSDEFQSLYKKIIKTDNNAEHDLNKIRDSLCEKNLKPGPFLCEYEVFKDIYRLEARISARTGQSSYISVLSLTGPNEQPLSPKALYTSMNRIKDIISSSLRRGDVFARYSVSQYLLMLQSASLEKSHLVISRILNNYKKAYPKSKAEIHFKLFPLEAAI